MRVILIYVVVRVMIMVILMERGHCAAVVKEPGLYSEHLYCVANREVG